MHYWGDEWFQKYGEDLRTAERYIFEFTEFFTGYHLSSKEKYGTIRYEWIVHPKTKEMFYPADTKEWKMIYVAIQSAIRQWPHLEDELLSDFACNEEIVGKEVHDKYWRRL